MAEDLELQSWDLQCERNHRNHRTSELGCQQLVVRRGQPFSVTLHFAGRSYEEGLDKLAFNVETAISPRGADLCQLENSCKSGRSPGPTWRLATLHP